MQCPRSNETLRGTLLPAARHRPQEAVVFGAASCCRAAASNSCSTSVCCHWPAAAKASVGQVLLMTLSLHHQLLAVGVCGLAVESALCVCICVLGAGGSRE